MPTRRRVEAGLVALAAALTLAAPAAAVTTVKVDARKLGTRVPDHFLGFSGEFDIMRAYLAKLRTAEVNTAFVQMTRNLAAFGGGAPVLRIGGGTTDSFWFADGSTTREPGDLYTIDYDWLKDVRAFTDATGSPLIVGVNLGTNDPALAQRWTAAVMNFFPRGAVKALEIGNEPDNFFQRVHVPQTGEMTRGPDYGPGQYLRELYAYTSAMLEVTPRPPIAGPSTVGDYGDWLTALPKIIANQRKRLKLVTLHRYPLFACGKEPGTKRDVDPRELMSPEAVEGHYGTVNTAIAAARKYGKRVRLTESNSVACGGSHGVSDAYASALWAVDWLMFMGAIGVEGVDFHSTSTAYQPFATGQDEQGRWAVAVRPLYYAMLFVAEATANNARFVESAYPAGGTVFRQWATYDAVERKVRVAIVNKSGRAGTMRLRVRGARGSGTVKRLSGPSLGATEGVTLGGRAFPDVSYDAKLPGPPKVSRVSRRKGAGFTVRMPRYGAALFTVRVRR